MATQFLYALPAPGQMVIFLSGGLLHLFPNRIAFRRQRLTLIQGLGTYLTGMIYAHQANAPGLVDCLDFTIYHGLCRIVAP